jgi:hypothetical protein
MLSVDRTRPDANRRLAKAQVPVHRCRAASDERLVAKAIARRDAAREQSGRPAANRDSLRVGERTRRSPRRDRRTWRLRLRTGWVIAGTPALLREEPTGRGDDRDPGAPDIAHTRGPPKARRRRGAALPARRGRRAPDPQPHPGHSDIPRGQQPRAAPTSWSIPTPTSSGSASVCHAAGAYAPSFTASSPSTTGTESTRPASSGAPSHKVAAPASPHARIRRSDRVHDLARHEWNGRAGTAPGGAPLPNLCPCTDAAVGDHYGAERRSRSRPRLTGK